MGTLSGGNETVISIGKNCSIRRSMQELELA